MVEEFLLNDVDDLRDAAQSIHRLVVDPKEFEDARKPGRWREFRSEPEQLFAAFPSLTLRLGYELRAFVYRDFWGGHGRVLARHNGAEFPDPEDAEVEAERDASQAEGFMESIAGDGSARSYLEASVFAREAEALGSFWHGLSWRSQTVLGGVDPWSPSSSDQALSAEDQWAWVLDRPETFNPTVTHLLGGGSTVVRFFSHDPLGMERIYANVDLYAGSESLSPTNHRAPMAIGPGGFIP